MDDKKYWIGFNLIKGLGAVRMRRLVAYFGELESAWNAVPAELANTGLGLKGIERVVQARNEVDLEKVWGKIEMQGIKILTWRSRAVRSLRCPVVYLRFQARARINGFKTGTTLVECQ